MLPASSATSSRHSGPSLSLAIVSRIMSEHAIAASFHAVLQSKEQERKPLTYSGTRPISIPVERAIAIWLGSTGNGRSPKFNGRRQPSIDGTSRMMREYQVRICERLGVKFPGPTRQSRRPDSGPATSGLPLMIGHPQSRSACLKGANNGKSFRPHHVCKPAFCARGNRN